MPEFTRRRFLGGAAAATAGGAAAALLPASVQKALATPPPTPGRLSDIKHVVLLMQENRSFHHNFGTPPPGSPLYEKSIRVSQIGQFEYDALRDQLATVFWLHPTNGASEHPAAPAPAPLMPDTGGNLNLAIYEVANLPAPAQTVPHQEHGHRPHV